MSHPDSCALHADGSLKDASDIVFFNDPDDDVLLLQVPSSAEPSSSNQSTRDAFAVLLKAGHTLAPVTAGSRRSGRPSKPSARVRDADNACGPSSSLSARTRKRGLSSATDHPAPKKAAMRFLSPLDSELDSKSDDEDIPSSAPYLEDSSSANEPIQPQLDDDNEADEARSENRDTTQAVRTAHAHCLPPLTLAFRFPKMNVQQMFVLYSLALLMAGYVSYASQSFVYFQLFFPL